MGKLIKADLPCERCGGNTSKAQYDGNEYCFKCGFSQPLDSSYSTQVQDIPFNGHLPADFKRTFPAECRYWYESVGLDLATLWRSQLGYSRMHNGVVIPFLKDDRLLGYQIKHLGRSPRKVTNVGKSYPVLCRTTLNNKGYVGIFEDIRSAMKCSKFIDTVCIFGTSLKSEMVKKILALGTKKVVIWLDGDEAGRIGTNKLLQSGIALARQIEDIHTPKDPKWYSYEEIEERLLCH